MRKKVTLEQKALDRYNSRVFFERRKTNVKIPRELAVEYAKQGKPAAIYKRYFVAREYNPRTKTKGKVLAYRQQKGSGIRTIIEATQVYSKNKTLFKDRVKIGGKIIRFEGSTLGIKDSITSLGPNTSVIVSEAKPKGAAYKYAQYYAYVTWRVKGGDKNSVGFSDMIRLGGEKLQAFERALGTACNDDLLPNKSSSGYRIDFLGEERGYITDKVSGERIAFNVNFQYQTFVQSKVQKSYR